MASFDHIKNIIFDLGNVIIDLDFETAYGNFADLSGLTSEEVKLRTDGLMFFQDYEKGLIGSSQFRDQIRQVLTMNCSDADIDMAWNSLLGGIPEERLQLLKRLRSNYRTFALSNTNEIHVLEFNNIIAESSGSVQSFMDHFEQVYYSCEMKMRKPEPLIYETVLQQQDLVAHETLFVDDHLPNIESASALGIHTYHLTHPNHLIALFNGASR